MITQRSSNTLPAGPSLRALALAGALGAMLLPRVATAQGCWIGIPQAAGAVTLNGAVGAGEWANAGTAASGDGCLESIVDRTGPNTYLSRPVNVAVQRDATFLYFKFEVEDLTTNLQQGSLGERIIVQIDPNNSRGPNLGTGMALDYRIDVTHRGTKAGGSIVLKDSGNMSPSCGGRPKWRDAPSQPAATDMDWDVGRVGDVYIVEFRIRLTAINVSVPSTIGLAFAAINDFNDVPSQGQPQEYGAAAFPSATLHFTSVANGVLDPATNSNPIGCSDWLTPDKWGQGYMGAGPTDVTITRMPVYWNSDGIALLNCANPGYDYYPHHPCRIITRATLLNSGGAAQRNVLYLWGNRDAASVRWSFMGLKKGVTIPAGSGTVPDLDWDVPAAQWALGEHPCMRVVVLPTSFVGAFSESRMTGMSNAPNADFAALMSAYGLDDNNWAQKNINRIPNASADCPIGSCPSVGALQISERPIELASLGFPLMSAWNLLQQQREPPTTRNPGIIYLNRQDRARYGRTDQIIQVQSFGYRQTSPSAPYTFVEIVGGAIELIPLRRLQAGPVDVSFTFTNGAPSTMTLIPVVDVQAPAGSSPITVSFDRRPITLEGNQSRTVRTSVRIGGRGGLEGPGGGPDGGGGGGCFGRVGTTGGAGILLGFAIFGIAIRRRRDA